MAEVEVLWFCPVEVINTVSTALFNLNEAELTESQILNIKEDFTSILFQCAKMLKKSLVAQNEALDYEEPETPET